MTQSVVSTDQNLVSNLDPYLRSGEDQTNNVIVTEEGQFSYETVAASQTNQVLGSTGAAGDYLHKLICVVATAATSAVTIGDGAAASVSVLPNNVGGGIGTYPITVNMVSGTGDWRITTGAGVSVIAVGRFT